MKTQTVGKCRRHFIDTLRHFAISIENTLNVLVNNRLPTVTTVTTLTPLGTDQ
jgi:hypothetical protein